MQGTKINLRRLSLLLGILGGACLLCVGGAAIAGRPALKWVHSLAWNADPGYAAQLAHTMIDYDLPAGYREQKGLDIQGSRTVIIASQSHPEDLILLEQGGVSSGVPGDTSTAEEIYGSNIDDRPLDTHPAGTQLATIRDQDVTLKLREGTDENGNAIRMLIGTFAGKNGDLLLVIVGNEDRWDQEMVDQFLASIR